MGFFSTDYKDVNTGFELIPEGEYEAVISEAAKTTFGTGSEGLKLTLTIRNDVDQPAQKRKLFENLIIGEKTMFKFQQVSKAVGLPEGVDYATPEAFGKAILYKGVRIRVKHEMQKSGKYAGQLADRVAFFAEPKVAYTGSPAGGPAADPFSVPGATPPPPPTSPDEANAPVDTTPKGGRSRRGANKAADEAPKPPWETGGQKDPFHDDGKPIDISDDDLPF